MLLCAKVLLCAVAGAWVLFCACMAGALALDAWLGGDRLRSVWVLVFEFCYWVVRPHAFIRKV